jgi:hypothetical protein
VINYLRMEDWNGGEEEVDDEEVHKEAFDEDEVDLEVIERDR